MWKKSWFCAIYTVFWWMVLNFLNLSRSYVYTGNSYAPFAPLVRTSWMRHNPSAPLQQWEIQENMQWCMIMSRHLQHHLQHCVEGTGERGKKTQKQQKNIRTTSVILNAFWILQSDPMFEFWNKQVYLKISLSSILWQLFQVRKSCQIASERKVATDCIV